jgi:hypothetical protein
MVERLIRLPVVKQTNLHEAVRSYSNPRLRDGASSYLDSEHRDELRDQSEIVAWDDVGRHEEVLPGIGTLRHIGLKTKQGYDYDALIGIPETQESGTPVIGTSAWFTSAEGHNEHIVRNLMRAGNYVFFAAGEGSFESGIKVRRKTAISLANSAAMLLNFSFHAGQELDKQGHAVSLSKRAVLGESRGAMVGMGVVALDEEFAQDVEFADLIAPCIPEKLDSLEDIVRLVEQVIHEPGEIIRLLGKLGLARGLHYSKTVDLSYNNLKHQVAIGGAIFNGEAGQLAKHIDLDKSMHILTFDNDFASMKGVWDEIFAKHENVTLTPLPGSHLTIADLQTLRFVIARNKALQEYTARGIKPTEKNIVARSHELYNAQFPLTHQYAKAS